MNPVASILGGLAFLLMAAGAVGVVVLLVQAAPWWGSCLIVGVALAFLAGFVDEIA